LALFLIR